MTKKSIVEEAVLELKTLKEIMDLSSKTNLQESVDDYLKEKVSEKLDSLNEEEQLEESDEEVDLNELLGEIEDEESPEDEISAEPEGEPSLSDTDADTLVSKMTADQLAALIKDIVSQELATADAGAEDALAPDEENDIDLDGIEQEGNPEDDIDLDELLNEIDAQITPTPQTVPTPTVVPSANTELDRYKQENEQLKIQLQEHKDAIKEYKKGLNEAKLYGSKSNHLAKVLAKFKLNESQSFKIAEKFDSAKTLKEVEIIYSTLNESLKIKLPDNSFKTKSIASNITGTAKTTLKESAKSEIIDDKFKLRMQELAGIRK